MYPREQLAEVGGIHATRMRTRWAGGQPGPRKAGSSQPRAARTNSLFWPAAQPSRSQPLKSSSAMPRSPPESQQVPVQHLQAPRPQKPLP